ncbi:MAG: hypothetical protein FJ293_00830 [Planctomycetes bacterium]|nr:hypothetical protein [Planctomycetota bacterium]
MRGKWLVAGVVVLGVVLALLAAWMRGRRGPVLPLKPGTALLVTIGDGELPTLGPFAADAIGFTACHGVSSELAATLGSIATSRMPREHGLVRAGDTLLPELRTFAELLRPQGFRVALFTCSTLPARTSGWARGADLVFENLAPDPATAAERAASWLLAAETAPALAWLHVDEWPQGAPATFLEQLAPVADRLLLAVAELGDRERPRLALRVPGGLLAAGAVARPVSLLDLAPTLLELYGAPVPSDWMEPFLLDPRTRAVRFFAFARPLPPPDLDADALTLRSGTFEFIADPAASPAERCEPPQARAEALRILREAYGWQPDAEGRFRHRRAPR